MLRRIMMTRTWVAVRVAACGILVAGMLDGADSTADPRQGGGEVESAVQRYELPATNLDVLVSAAPPEQDAIDSLVGELESTADETVPIRFIRIRHRGVLWDDGMTARTGSADARFLTWLTTTVTDTSVAVPNESEAMAVADILATFEPAYRPPFVFVTANGGFELEPNDQSALRDLCLGGTLLIADAGSPAFHESFVALMQVVFPEYPLVAIGPDDPLFRSPHHMANGVLSLQWHGPTHLMGIYINGRWAVVYHPGDMNDMWKDQASRLSLREISLRLGHNLVAYAIKHYRMLHHHTDGR